MCVAVLSLTRIAVNLTVIIAIHRAGQKDEDKRRMMAQIAALDHHYNGGLQGYIRNAKQLLSDSKEGRNPFDGYTPSVPDGVRLDFAGNDFMKYERTGLQQAGLSAYVLVAGGLGERLGYSGEFIMYKLRQNDVECRW